MAKTRNRHRCEVCGTQYRSFAQLYERMRRALALKQVRRGELGWRVELDQPVTGRIEADLLELRARHSIDVAGGPLLDEE